MTIGAISITIGEIPLDQGGLDTLVAGVAQQTTESFAQQTTLDQGVVNNVQVVIADSAALTAPTTTTLNAVTATAADSVTTFGETSAQLVVILDNSTNPVTNVSFAQDLAVYLVRQVPEYWFSNIEISMNGLTEPQRDIVALLDIGDQIRVSKRFPNVVTPVVQTLFVEGIDHKISPSNHTVLLQCSPADTYIQFILDTNELDDELIGLG